MEVEDAFTARRPLERVFNEARRQYSGVPKRAIREVPVPNAPNIEIPLGAILADDIYSQASDTLFTASPLVTVRQVVDDTWLEHAKDAQVWVNWLAANELDLHSAVNAALLDDTQLGTGVLYIPWINQSKKDRVYHVRYRSPKVVAIAPEDLILPPGSRGNLQLDRWVAVRFWYSKGELEERALKLGWDTSGASPVAQFDLVRMQHERKANLRGTPMWREVYEVLEVYCYFDYDGDGLEEDLLVTFDRASRTLLNVSYNPYDVRPLEVMRYQLRSHLPYGLGVLEMTQPFQEEVTELHNYTILNIFLASAKVWVARDGAVPNKFEIYPGKAIKVNAEDVRSALMELKMSEVYPSAFQAQAGALQLAERRIGTSGAAGMLAKGGSRTPGVTALSLLQQVNRRFSPAFADMRHATAAAIKQAVYRYRERLLARDAEVEDHIISVMGTERGQRIIELLTISDFERNVVVEMTASTAQVNREADRQNAIMISQLMQGYYQQTVALTLQAATQPMPPEMRTLLMDVAKKGTELMDRALRTFDQVRDPNTLLVDLTKVEATLNTADELQAQAEAFAAQAIASGQAPPGALPQEGVPTGEPAQGEAGLLEAGEDIAAPGIASAGVV